MNCAGEDFRNPGRVIDLGGPLGRLSEDCAVVHFLEGLAIAHAAFNLPDENDQRGRILLGDVDSGQCVGGAGPPGHHANPGLAGELAQCVCHHGSTPFLAADGHVDVDVDQRVEHREKALAGDAKNVFDAVGHQLADEDLPAGARRIRGWNVGHVGCGDCVIGQTSIISWRADCGLYSLKSGGSLRSVAGVRESLMGEARPR